MVFSVIIATYNAENVLSTTLDSLKKQTCKNFELIIIDGNSNDSTKNIITSNLDIVSSWISEPDNGIYDAWNKGIRMAKGEWICFIGAGDTLVPDALEKYAYFIHKLKDKVDYISAKIARTTENNTYTSDLGEPYTWKSLRKKMNVAHVGSLHNKNLFKEIGLYNTEYKIAADYELLLRKKGKLKAVFMDYVIGTMPIGGISFSVKALKEAAKAKRETGQISTFSIFYHYIIGYILLKTYRIRHK
ncbi:MAG: glycosyltransferase family 2 protein [Dysgonomonas sp.]